MPTCLRCTNVAHLNPATLVVDLDLAARKGAEKIPSDTSCIVLVFVVALSVDVGHNFHHSLISMFLPAYAT